MLPTMNRRRELTRSPFDWFDREFDRMLSDRWGREPETFGVAYPADVREDDSNVYIEAELPGFKKDEVEIAIEQGTLTITAERREKDRDEKKEGYHLSERSFRRYQRAFALPTQVDETGAEAKLDSGVLHLTLPKSQEVKPRQIEIK